VTVVVVVMVVMLVGMFAAELATAFIMAMHPSMMIAPRPRYPHPFVTTVPIRGAVVIWPIAHVDRDPDRRGAWPNKHANRQESRRENRKFRFHSRYQLFARGQFLAL
jgi:hypothetical protein